MSHLASVPSLGDRPDKPEDDTPETKSPPQARQKLARALPSDRITFARQLDVLRGFAVAAADNGGSASANQVGPLISMSHHTIALLIAFFTEIGLLGRVGSGRYAPAAAVTEYSRALQWTPETAAHRLAPIIGSSWFGKMISTRISVNPRNVDEIMTDLAGEAAASVEHRPQIELLVEYAIAAGIATRDGGLLRQGTPLTPRHEAEPVATPAATGTAPVAERTGVDTSFSRNDATGGVSFDVSVRVQMSDFAGWRPERISAFFGGIAAVLAAKGAMEKEVGGSGS
jgi:hypothetical protein